MELRIDRLTKQYGSKIAVDRLRATLTPGVYGLLGANGAGKTTLMRLICDIQSATTGTVYFDNQDIREAGEMYRNCLGYLPQNFGYYPEFTAYKFLLYMAALKGIPKMTAKTKTLELLKTVGLLEEKNKKIKTFSGGMKRRLGIAQAMLNDPQILILDEPTAGLDPKERVKFRNLISSFSQDKIVILSTHIVSDIEYIADWIFVMKDGKFVHQGTVEEITGEIDGYVWECDVDRRTADKMIAEYNVGNIKNRGEDVVLRIVSKEKPIAGAVQTEPTLEDLYLFYFDEEGEQDGRVVSI